MRKKLLNTSKRQVSSWLWPLLTVAALVLVWQAVAVSGVVPGFLLPAPTAVARAFADDFALLMSNLGVTLVEAACGLVLSMLLGLGAAVLMDRFATVKKALYPLLVLTQTVPPIAIAPLLVLWFGFGIAPKVLLIVIVCFFPLAVGFMDGFAACDRDQLDLLRSMGATRRQLFRYVKFPASLPHFFAGLKLSASYCVVSAVIAEWLGGSTGLGVYMTRVRKAYDFESMFAVIILIAALSLALMAAVALAEKRAMPYRQRGEKL